MDVLTYSLAKRDRRWPLVRELMAAEEVGALVCDGEDGPIELNPLTAQLLRA
jgi:hypothetical protein